MYKSSKNKMTLKPSGESDYFIVYVPIVSPPNVHLPFLVLGENFCLEQIAYARKLLRGNWSPSTIERVTTTIGLLHNYWKFAYGGKLIAPEELPLFLEKFAEARYYGTMEKDGSDNTGLNWSGCTIETARTDVRHISKFFQYCATEFRYAHINPTVETNMTCGEQVLEVARRSSRDLLFHLYETTASSQGRKQQLRFQLRDRRSSHGVDQKLALFPVNKVAVLVLESPSLRDQLLWFLLAFGGIRVSEALNLFVDDIDVGSDGAAIIYLKDPCKGVDERYDSNRYSTVKMSRSDFLRERYGLISRDRLSKNNPYHAGWKGMMWDYGKDKVSVVHWLTPKYGRQFWRMHQAYMRQIRGHIPDKHPYYFVSTNNDHYGDMLKRGNVRLQFSRACKRVGIRKSEGAGRLHVLRHFYKWVSCVLGGISLADQRRRMHHYSLESTNGYGIERVEDMHRRLRSSYEQIEVFLNLNNEIEGCE